MTWHLKDRELERKLIAIDSGFLEKLNEACEKLDNNKDGDFPKHKNFSIEINNGVVKVFLNSVSVEKCTRYDPNKWNDYPEVTPPEGILMRVETDRFRDCAIFKDGYWHSELFGEPNGRFQAEVECFRPWSD